MSFSKNDATNATDRRAPPKITLNLEMSSIIKQKHPYHLVDPSPWPLVLSISCLVTALGAATFMHSFQNAGATLVAGLAMVISGMSVWWRDVIREATFNGYHTKTVQHGLRYGMILFIVSEVMFFLAFFWAFFHSSLSPTIEIGSVWPPVNINVFNPWGVPLLNTFILLLSGATVTWAHHEIIVGRKEHAKLGLLLTLFLAVTFTALQAYEYIEASFSISDGIYGSTFFMATGFHGYLHMIAPTNLIFLPCILFLLGVESLALIACTRHAITHNKLDFSVIPTQRQDQLLIQYKGKYHYLDHSFLQWLSGFTDAEGNFNISLRNFKDDRRYRAILAFQIGLHIDDLDTLKDIQKIASYGHISISGSKCNYFVDGRSASRHVVLPIFRCVPFNNFKYLKFSIFEKAVNMVSEKKTFNWTRKISHGTALRWNERM